jgi:alcohol dehydrogenase (cytochrome c)
LGATIDDLVVSGVAGGDAGARGFVVAYDQATGKERWRFWTVPAAGEPGSETRKGSTAELPGVQPGWPARATRVSVGRGPATAAGAGGCQWQGFPRKLLLDANRNGFYYVLDRTNGKVLLAKPFVNKLTWAREIGADGRPVVNADQRPSAKGTRVCPSLIGAANCWSTAFDPATGFYYVQTLESCGIFTKRETQSEAGRGFNGGQSPDDRPQKFLRAIDIRTGKIAWELPESGPGTTRGGVLATAGGIVFFCADSNALMAVDSSTGRPLWHFQTNHFWRASSMNYVIENRQYVAVSSGPNIIAFGLPD